MSSHENIDSRITKIESQLPFHTTLVEETRKDIKEVKEGMNEIKTSIALIQASLQNNVTLEPRVRKLEDNANAFLGGWKTITVFGSLALLLLRGAWELIKSNKGN
jgi:peptidoglycan hydrolase CwlO-like protein